MTPADIPYLTRFLELFGDNPYVHALVLVVGGAIFAKLADLTIVHLLSRWTRRSKSTLDDEILAILHRPLFVSVFFIGLWLALESLVLSPSTLMFCERVLQTTVVLVWLVFGFRFSHLFLTRLGALEGKVKVVQPRTVPLFENTARLLLFGGGVYAVFLVWDVNVAALLGTLGVAGIAIGFAAKDSIANLLSGISIIADAPYQLGDYIVLESGERGQVTHIGLRSTRILTRDDVEVTVPNALIAGDKIVNETGGRWPKYRIRVKVGVAYGSDVDRVEEVLERVAAEHPEALDHPQPRVRFRAFGESSLDFELLCWIEQPVLRGRVLHELNRAVYQAFAAEGIEIPFPQRDVHLISGESEA
jgi:small-conductance mechanosensitive channel